MKITEFLNTKFLPFSIHQYNSSTNLRYYEYILNIFNYWIITFVRLIRKYIFCVCKVRISISLYLFVNTNIPEGMEQEQPQDAIDFFAFLIGIM